MDKTLFGFAAKPMDEMSAGRTYKGTPAQRSWRLMYQDALDGRAVAGRVRATDAVFAERCRTGNNTAANQPDRQRLADDGENRAERSRTLRMTLISSGIHRLSAINAPRSSGAVRRKRLSIPPTILRGAIPEEGDSHRARCPEREGTTMDQLAQCASSPGHRRGSFAGAAGAMNLAPATVVTRLVASWRSTSRRGSCTARRAASR